MVIISQATINATSGTATFTSAAWDLENTSGTVVANGDYFIRIHVTSDGDATDAPLVEQAVTIGIHDDLVNIADTSPIPYLSSGTIRYTTAE